MNYLAHLYLAGNDEGLLIGNFIADGIRGKEIEKFPLNIQKGIMLHRHIDTFTDSHPIVKKTNQKLRESAGKYAPVVSDIVYDHFLALHWKDYSNEPLAVFAEKSYHFLAQKKQYLPENMQEVLYYMTEQNWLVNYSNLQGIARTLRDLSQRVHFANTMANSIIDLQKNYTSFYNDFKDFFPLIQRFVASQKLTL